MQHIGRLLQLTLILVSSLSLQASTSSISIVQEAKPYITLEGRFSIALPAEPGVTDISQTTSKATKTGRTYKWQIARNAYDVTFLDFPGQFQESKEVQMFFEILRNEIHSRSTTQKITVVKEEEISLNGFRGYEIKSQLPAAISISRLYLVDSRFYEVTAAFPISKPEEEMTCKKVLDSFHPLVGDELQAAIIKRMEEETPALSTQPAIKRPTSDTQDQGLKGKVKLVISDDKNLLFNYTDPTIELHYDELGYRTKSVRYEADGIPAAITVYGYLDGERVTQVGVIPSDHGRLPRILLPGETNKPEDPRYNTKYRYKYNDGRLIEETVIRNTGDVLRRYVYKYAANEKEVYSYEKGDKLEQKYSLKLDDQGNEVEEVFYDIKSGKVSERYRMEYEFDAQGNWTKCLMFKWTEKDGQGSYQPYRVSTRKITYYK